MKKFLPFGLLVLLFACKKHSTSSPQSSQWTGASNYIGRPVVDPVGFGIGGRLYIGMGVPSPGDVRGTQCYAYDTTANSWFQLASYPNPTLVGPGFGFAIGGTGYVLLSKDTLTGELWAYDTAQNVWTKMANFPGRFTAATTGFSVNGKAYVGFGDTSDPRTFYQYDPASGNWSTISDFAGLQSAGTVSFVIGNYAYVGLGGNLLSGVDAGLYDAFYRYDPAADKWQGIANFPGSQRDGATGFSVGNKGYVVGGSDVSGNLLKDVWQYDPTANAWAREPDFPGTARDLALGFSDSTSAWFGFGIGAGYAGLTDLWRFTP